MKTSQERKSSLITRGIQLRTQKGYTLVGELNYPKGKVLYTYDNKV